MDIRDDQGRVLLFEFLDYAVSVFSGKNIITDVSQNAADHAQHCRIIIDDQYFRACVLFEWH